MSTFKIGARFIVLFSLAINVAHSQGIDRKEELKSGYHYSHQDTRNIQDDSFANPGIIYLQRGKALWNKVEGEQNKSCATCHGSAKNSMAGLGTSYPKIDKQTNKLINLGQRVQICRVQHMSAPIYIAPEHEAENDDLLSLEAYIMMQSNGMAMNVNVNGFATKYFERGRELYHQRIGQSDLACYQCHDDRVSGLLRAERISQGHINGFPTYILRWDRIASVHRRFQFCNAQARAEPLPLNHSDYNALQLYVAWRGNGLSIEVPSVRR